MLGALKALVWLRGNPSFWEVVALGSIPQLLKILCLRYLVHQNVHCHIEMYCLYVIYM